MPCKKSDLVSAINSYASARATGDANLQVFSASLVEKLVDSLEYAPEEEKEEEAAEEEKTED